MGKSPNGIEVPVAAFRSQGSHIDVRIVAHDKVRCVLDVDVVLVGDEHRVTAELRRGVADQQPCFRNLTLPVVLIQRNIGVKQVQRAGRRLERAKDVRAAREPEGADTLLLHRIVYPNAPTIVDVAADSQRGAKARGPDLIRRHRDV